MEQIDLTLALVRGICMAYYLTQGTILLIEGRNSRIKLSMGGVMILYADQFVMNVASSYMSDDPSEFSQMLSMFEMFAVPATAMFFYELIQQRGLSARKIIYNFLPFVICFLLYSVTHNNLFFISTTTLAVVYGLLALTYFQSLLIRRLRFNTNFHPEERPYFVRLNIVMWLLLLLMCVWSILVYDGNPLALIFYNVFMLAVWIIMSYLVNKGSLKFVNKSMHDFDDEEFDDEDSFVTDKTTGMENAESVSDNDSEARDEADADSEDQLEQNGAKSYRDAVLEEKVREFRFYMEVQKAYLDPSLSINDVSAHLSTNRTYASVIINKYFNTTFSAYVNSLRISHAKQLLISTTKTIEEIYKISGFHSRSTFWRAFCQQENCTPKEFRNQFFNPHKEHDGLL